MGVYQQKEGLSIGEKEENEEEGEEERTGVQIVNALCIRQGGE